MNDEETRRHDQILNSMEWSEISSNLRSWIAQTLRKACGSRRGEAVPMNPRKGRIVYGTKKQFFIDETEVSEAEFRKAFPPKELAAGDEVMAQSTSAWQDFTSEAMAVHPDQVGQANERSKKHNLGVKYDKKGFAHIPDRTARKKLMRLEGLHDKKGGYGD